MYNVMQLIAQLMEMMQALIAEGYTEIDHDELAIFYAKLNGVTMKDF